MRAFAIALALSTAEAVKLVAKQNLDARGFAGKIFDEMDANKNGVLAPQELADSMAAGGFTDDVIGKAEHAYKTEAGGDVTRAEFQDAIEFLYNHALEQGLSDGEIESEIKNFDPSKVTVGDLDAAADYGEKNFAQQNDRAGAEAAIAAEVGAAFDLTDVDPADGKVTGNELAASLDAAGFTPDVTKAIVDEFNTHPEVGGEVGKADLIGWVTDLYHTAADAGISDDEMLKELEAFDPSKVTVGDLGAAADVAKETGNM